jgi:RNA polymerase sigma factor (sigma-70 family)
MSGQTNGLNELMTNTPGNAGEWFRTVVGRYEGPLLRYTAQITGDVEQARDVVQDAFLRLHQQVCGMKAGSNGHVGHGVATGKKSQHPHPGPLPEGEGVRPDNVQAWLYTVCRRRALDVLRKETRMKTLNDCAAAICESPLPSQTDAMEQAETESQVRDLLGDLPENQQEVVRLKFQDYLSYRDIAEVTGLTVSNVGYLLHVAVKRLREQLVVSE